MTTRTKLIREGNYLIAVEVEMVEPATGWGPCLTLSAAESLDDAREALRKGDFQAASAFGTVYHLVPLSA